MNLNNNTKLIFFYAKIIIAQYIYLFHFQNLEISLDLLMYIHKVSLPKISFNKVFQGIYEKHLRNLAKTYTLLLNLKVD